MALDYKIDVNAQHVDGMSLFMLFAAIGHVAAAECILSNGNATVIACRVAQEKVHLGSCGVVV